MTKVLVKFNDNYANEEGHKVFDLNEWETHLEFVKKLNFPRKIYFRTDEFCEYYNYDEYVESFTIQGLSDEGYSELEKLKLLEGGIFLYIDPAEYVDEESEENLV